MSLKLGEILVREHLITPQQLQEAIEHQRRNGGRLGTSLVKLGFVSQEVIADVLSRQYGVRTINLDLFQIERDVINLVPREIALKYSVIPVARNGATLTLAMADPTNVFALDDIKFMTGLNIEPVIAMEDAINKAIDKYYSSKEIQLTEEFEAFEKLDFKPTKSVTPSTGENGKGSKEQRLSEEEIGVSVDLFRFEKEREDLELLNEDNEEIDVSRLLEESEDSSIIKLANILIVDAVRRGTSDIHIEPYEKDFRIRFRIDGVLYDVMHPPLTVRDALISRLKIMARLDISEKRLPQDGRIKIKMKVEERSRELDLRVSTLPTLFGEKVVLRLLDKGKLMLDMTKLGFEPRSLEIFKRNIQKPYGMVLVTGPTGSGKTNTLYSALQALNTPETNIMTAEDPVEFNIPGINQVQIREQIGLTFASALRSFLRQDPNIIMVGEIRDFETAEIAIKAALTGHLVLSTLHTNDAPSTISRLVNMGIEPYLVATSVNVIQAQRLVRRICSNCKEETHVSPEVLISIGFSEEEAHSLKVYHGKGCKVCNGTGYKGRIGLYEVMEMDDELRELVVIGATAMELRRKAIENGMITLRESGLCKIRDGITTIEEVVRETVL
jgi:type IV pilus assembly protein PilB